MITEPTKELAQTAPPVVVTTVHLYGVALQDWVYAATLLYTAIQIIRVAPKLYGCTVCFLQHGTCDRSCIRGKQ